MVGVRIFFYGPGLEFAMRGKFGRLKGRGKHLSLETVVLKGNDIRLTVFHFAVLFYFGETLQTSP